MLKFLYYNDPPPRGSPGMGTHSLGEWWEGRGGGGGRYMYECSLVLGINGLNEELGRHI